MIRKILFLVAILFAAPAFGRYPYDSACSVSIEHGRRGIGGSGVLIAADDKHGLVLTVKHVAMRAGNPAECNWAGKKYKGEVLAVHPTADIGLIIVDRPAGIVPVPVALPSAETGPFVLVGFPGYDRETARYQIGKYVALDEDTLTVDCAPEKGMSGGPTFDRYGRVTGAVSAYNMKRGFGYVGSGQALIELITPYVH